MENLLRLPHTERSYVHSCVMRPKSHSLEKSPRVEREREEERERDGGERGGERENKIKTYFTLENIFSNGRCNIIGDINAARCACICSVTCDSFVPLRNKVVKLYSQTAQDIL